MKQLSDSFRFLWDLGHTQVTINTGKYELTGFCCWVWSQEDTPSCSPEEKYSVLRFRLWPARRGSWWWNHRTSDSRLSGVGDPSCVLLWTPCRDAQGLTSKWTLCVYWSGLWSVTAGIEQEYTNRPSCDIGTSSKSAPMLQQCKFLICRNAGSWWHWQLSKHCHSRGR